MLADPVLTSPPLVAFVPQQENGDANGANGAVHDDVGALHGVMSPSEPKVMIPYKTKPGEVPRQVQIERKKRLFKMMAKQFQKVLKRRVNHQNHLQIQ